MAFIPDFTDVASFEEIKERFMKSAESIMLRHHLVRGDHSWLITALELYLFTDSDIWRDPYTHRSREQLESGTWYVHRPHYSLQREGRWWRPPKRSGIDITCGSKSRDVFGGLLVRQICKNKGSGTAFTTIVRAGKDFHFQKWSDDDNNLIRSIDGERIGSRALLLSPLPRQRDESIWIGPRVGLRARNPDPKNPEGISFRDACLRAATWRMDERMEKWTTESSST